MRELHRLFFFLLLFFLAGHELANGIESILIANPPADLSTGMRKLCYACIHRIHIYSLGRRNSRVGLGVISELFGQTWEDVW
jgi:hypothetical protein